MVEIHRLGLPVRYRHQRSIRPLSDEAALNIFSEPCARFQILQRAASEMTTNQRSEPAAVALDGQVVV